MRSFFHDGSRQSLAVILLFLGLYLPLQWMSSSRRSATVDEPIHLAAGYAALANGDYRFDPTHPPLLRMWTALPLLGRVEGRPDLAPDARVGVVDWVNADSYKAAAEFLGNEPDRLLMPARFMTMVLGALLGILVYCWTLELLGFRTACAALLFYLVEPNLAAHGSLVTTDLGIALFTFSTIYFLWRSIRRFTAGNLACLAASFAMACASKFSAVGVAAIAGVLLLVAWRRGGEFTSRRAWTTAALLVVSGYLAVWAAYRFRYAPAPGAAAVFESASIDIVRERMPVTAAILQQIDSWHLLPNAYVQGLILCNATAKGIAGFLAGEVAVGGWWYYFPVAFAIKTPVALLALAAAGLAFHLRWKRRDLTETRAWLLLPVAIYMAFAVSSSINIGLRHILPVYPFAIVVAAAGWHFLGRSPLRAARLAAVALLALAPIRWAQAWPRTLSHFNLLVGGPSQGHRFLSDSNLDWGQGLKELRAWMDANGVQHINLAYSGTVHPSAYGIECTLLPGSAGFLGIAPPTLPGYVGISTTLQSLVGLDPQWGLFYEGFRTAEPVATVGNTIRIYRAESWPEPSLSAEVIPGPEEAEAHLALADSMNFNLRWHRMATRHYRHYLKSRPHDGRALSNLALALLADGSTLEARQEFALLMTTSPDPGKTAISIAVLLGLNDFPEESLLFASHAVRVRPNDPVAHDTAGVALARVGRYREAAAALSRAIELDPASSHARENLAKLNLALQQ